MPDITWTFNTSTGSDTQASGSPQPTTAIFGTAASFTGSVVTLDGSPDLSGFDANTWGLWLLTSTGRQYFDLVSADNGAKTVTTVDAPAGTSTGRTWAIGGKRSTWENTNSRALFVVLKTRWVVVTETTQSLNSALTISSQGSTTTGLLFVRGLAGAKRIVTQSANAEIFSVTSGGGNIRFENLHLQNTSGTKTNAAGVASGQSNVTIQVKDCILGHATNTLDVGVTRSTNTPRFFIDDSEILSCVSSGISITGGGTTKLQVTNCYIHNNGANGIVMGSGDTCRIKESIFANNGGDGVQLNFNSALVTMIHGNVFHNNTGDGLDISASAGAADIKDNIFSNNTGYGIRAEDANINHVATADFNNFFSNSAGPRLNITAGANDTALDPQYTAAASGDYSVGTNLKEQAYPEGAGRTIGANQSATRSYKDIGVSQRQEPAGGASSVLAVSRRAGGKQ